ncbi:uncharacterized protein N7459_003146 [Penicillium hispanicum]|uniref:uncharacterized protein n=1 Tax=Penicillium hispanicum TaxID=1080232 RepID=UPI00253FD187|nr:uncharacterized protein N7459_003146 [Penicillium hispanicum]KAJ5587381.1 hypothetical protein N7459_003146 [Penicillium hispanicum]
MTAREETVLPPIDPSISDENDWWEFSLTDVKVLRPGKMLYANLLEATEQYPVQVIGCLELKPNQEHLVLNPDYLSKRIIIDDVTHYAYGQTEDRSVELWVAGKAGWYRISPAKGYLPTFNRMVQAVDMYYFLMDRHRQGKKQLNPTFKNLCEQYIFHTRGDCETREQSAETFAAHGAFLLRCMVEDDEDMEWSKTNVFVHLRRQFSDEYKNIMERLSPKSENGEVEDEPIASTPRHDPTAVVKSQTDAVYQLIRDLREEGQLAKRRLHIDLLTERLSDRYSFSREDARKIIVARASAVLEKLDDEDTPGFKWSRYVIHRELTHAASQDGPLPPALLTPLQPIEDSSDDEDLARTQKSVLRPKIASVSHKLMGKRNRKGVAGQETTQSNDEDEEKEEDDPDAMSDVETPSKTRGHDLIRTPFSSAKAKTPTTLPEPGAAAALLKSMLLEPTQSANVLTSTTNNGIPESSTLHIPAGSNGTSEPEVWTCRMPGCTKALSSKGDQRKQEIEAHAGEHDWETQMRVELVETERRMHSAFPVSNLMQYLINQHYQQMRAAFPEIYPAQPVHENGNANANGIENGTTQHPNASKESLPSSPTQHRSADKLNHSMNGHAT